METMERQAAIIGYTNKIIEAIDAFRWSGVPDDIIIKRIYYLCKFEKTQAEREIDMKLDAMEREIVDVE